MWFCKGQTMRFLFGNYAEGRVALGLLIFRVVMGAGMMVHGWDKIQKPFTWMNKIGEPPSDIPGVMQMFAAVAEFMGGLGLVVGFLTPAAAAGVMAVMFGAWYIAHYDDPWIGKKGSFETASLYFLAGLVIFITGPGRFSLDCLLFGGPKRVTDDRLSDIGPPK